MKLKAWSTAMARLVETTTILNAQPFWTLLGMNTLWFFKSVADLCFTTPFAVLGKAKYLYRPLCTSSKRFRCEISKHNLLSFDLELWPMILTYNPSLAKIKVSPHAKKQGHRSSGRVVTDGQTDGRYQTYYLPCFAVDNYKLKADLEQHTTYIFTST